MKDLFRSATGALLLLLLFAAVEASASGGGETPTAGQPMTITWMMAYQEGETTSWFVQELEKKFNVKIVANGIGTNDTQKVGLMKAAGEFPDCGAGGLYGPVDYADGLIRSIPKSFIRTYMPGYTKIMDTMYPMAWLLGKAPGKDDEYITLQGVSAGADGPTFYPAFRADWARNVGVELKDYDKKKIKLDRFNRVYFLDENYSLEWLENLLVKFRDGDPDKNGKVDTIPWGAYYHGGFAWAWAPLLGSYGLGFNNNFLVDGKLVDNSIHPEYKEFLKRMASWYQMGLIDKEFVTLDRNKGYEKVAKGLVGACSAQISYAGTDFAMNRPPNSLVRDDELGTGAEVVMIPPPIGPKGQQGCYAYLGVSALGYANWAVNSKVKDDKLIMILRILDYMNYDDDKVWLEHYKGMAGVHFDWEGEPWNSMAISRATKDVPAGYPKQGNFPTEYPPCYTPQRQKYMSAKDLANFTQTFLLGARGQSLAIRSYREDVFQETKATEVWRKYGANLNTMVQEFFYKGVTGNLNIDAEWNGYVQNWRKNGGDEYLAEMAKAPIVSELRKGNLVY